MQFSLFVASCVAVFCYASGWIGGHARRSLKFVEEREDRSYERRGLSANSDDVFARLNFECKSASSCNEPFGGQSFFSCKDSKCTLTKEGEDFINANPPTFKRDIDEEEREDSFEEREDSFERRGGLSANSDDVFARLNFECKSASSCNEPFGGQSFFSCKDSKCTLTKEGEEFINANPPTF